MKCLSTENDWYSQEAGGGKNIAKFKFYDYAPLVFQRIRQKAGIVEEEYLKSLGPEQIINSFWTQNYQNLYELCSSGQSGSLFYYTKDKKYMMKTIPFREFKKMRQVLRDYFNHIKKHSNSLIIRFYGLHEVKWTDLKGKVQVRYLCIMGNIF